MSKTESVRKTYIGFFARPTAAYFLIISSLTFLSGLGLLMVLSSSSVKSFEATGSTYSIFLRQLLFLAIAIGSCYLAFHLKPRLWDQLAKFGLIIGAIILLIPQIPHVGKNINGNTNWIAFGAFTIQPSEFAKMVLILWCALQLKKYDNKIYNKSPLRHIFFLVPGVLLFLALIMNGKDLGTAIIVFAIGAAMLFIAGVDIRYFFALGLSGAALASLFVFTSKNRIQRFTAFLHPFDESVYKLAGWQTAHSVMGLASGGLFGVGLGASKQKWANLSEANTDFIFSVIGEELGLLGTLIILLLYAALIYGILRTSLHAKDIFSKYACAGIAAWFLIQVTVNIGSDIGLLPVVGVTLPFISYGGSSLIANFIAVGFVLNVIRRDPEVRAALHAKKSR